MEEVAFLSYIPQNTQNTRNTRKLNEQRLDSLDSSDSWFLFLAKWLKSHMRFSCLEILAVIADTSLKIVPFGAGAAFLNFLL